MISKKKEFSLCPLLPQTSDSSFGVVSSFACPNLHHITHRITPPHRSSELCMELVNIPVLSWATIQLFVFHDLPFFPVWILNYWWCGFFLGGFSIFWYLERWRSGDYTTKITEWMELQKRMRIYKLGSLPPSLLVFARNIAPVDHRWNQHGLHGDNFHGESSGTSSCKIEEIKDE